MYAFSILFTGAVNFIAIPVLKIKIGSGEFAYLNLYMNLLLIVSYIGAGWLVQSCIRFFSSASRQPGFGSSYKKLSIISAFVTVVAAFITVVFFKHYSWMLIAFPLTILFVNLQSLALAWMQASIKPKVVAVAEIIRSLVFLSFILVLKKDQGYNLIIMAWVGWLASYALSLVFLWGMVKRYPVSAEPGKEAIDTRSAFTKFSAFGFPLSLFLGAHFTLFFADRFFLLKHQPPELVGHYSALFDVLQKGIGFVLSPFITAAYPLLARLYEEHNHSDVKKLSTKILRWQLLITVLVLLGYWLCWPLLKAILHIDDAGHMFFISGFLMIGGAAIWQINMMLHKPFELEHKTWFLLAIATICVGALLLADYFIVPIYGFVGAAAVFFTATLLYSVIILARRSYGVHGGKAVN